VGILLVEVLITSGKKYNSGGFKKPH